MRTSCSPQSDERVGVVDELPAEVESARRVRDPRPQRHLRHEVHRDDEEDDQPDQPRARAGGRGPGAGGGLMGACSTSASGSPPPAPVYVADRRPGRPPRPRRRPPGSPVDRPPSSPRLPPRSGKIIGSSASSGSRSARISWTPVDRRHVVDVLGDLRLDLGVVDEVDELERRRRVRGADRDHHVVEEQVAAVGGPGRFRCPPADQGARPRTSRSRRRCRPAVRSSVYSLPVKRADLAGVDAPRELVDRRQPVLLRSPRRADCPRSAA